MFKRSLWAPEILMNQMRTKVQKTHSNEFSIRVENGFLNELVKINVTVRGTSIIRNIGASID